MPLKKNIIAITGSASRDSANLKLVQKIKQLTSGVFNLTIIDNLAELPHFNPELSLANPPVQVLAFRQSVLQADGIIISTPEYIFSIPSVLKNAIEWCVATTVFSKKPIGLITAAASGKAGHEELQLIMKTVETAFTDETTLLIPGIKGKIDADGNITHTETEIQINQFICSYQALVEKYG